MADIQLTAQQRGAVEDRGGSLLVSAAAGSGKTKVLVDRLFRYVTEEQIPELLDIAVMDVSFISVKLVLPAVQRLLKPDADIVCLIKPQFEAGREEVGKKGVVRDSTVHKEVIRSVLDFAPGIGLTPVGLDFSPIKGPEGNIEYICHLKNGDFAAPQLDVDAVVAASHEAL